MIPQPPFELIVHLPFAFVCISIMALTCFFICWSSTNYKVSKNRPGFYISMQPIKVAVDLWCVFVCWIIDKYSLVRENYVACKLPPDTNAMQLLLSRVRLFATPWTIAHQAPLSVGFSRQEYWSGLPFPSPGNLPDPGIKTVSPAFTDGFFTTEPPGKLIFLH